MLILDNTNEVEYEECIVFARVGDIKVLHVVGTGINIINVIGMPTIQYENQSYALDPDELIVIGILGVII